MVGSLLALSWSYFTEYQKPCHVLLLTQVVHFEVESTTLAKNRTILVRVRAPYALGDFYSIKVRNGYGQPSSALPFADEGEPDNSPTDASELEFDIYSQHGLDPVLDEDWFSFTSAGEVWHYVSTKSNLSGDSADPDNPGLLKAFGPVAALTVSSEKQIGFKTITSYLKPK